jgi:hypothetical protein
MANPVDQQLVEAVARVWIKGGGDAEGIEWCWGDIRDTVQQLQEEAEEGGG